MKITIEVLETFGCSFLKQVNFGDCFGFACISMPPSRMPVLNRLRCHYLPFQKCGICDNSDEQNSDYFFTFWAINIVTVWVTVFAKDAKYLLAIDESYVTNGLCSKQMISLNIPACHQVPVDTVHILQHSNLKMEGGPTRALRNQTRYRRERNDEL